MSWRGLSDASRDVLLSDVMLRGEMSGKHNRTTVTMPPSMFRGRVINIGKIKRYGRPCQHALRFIKPCSVFGDSGGEFMKSSNIFYWLERNIILLASGEPCKAKAQLGRNSPFTMLNKPLLRGRGKPPFTVFWGGVGVDRITNNVIFWTTGPKY